MKVCGITRIEDAEAAYRLGFSAVGFIFVPQSPRRVSPDRARLISMKIPPSVLRVGVVAGAERKEILRLMDFCRLDLVQFHGGEGPDDIAPFASRAIKVLRPRCEEDLGEAEDFPQLFAFLVDAWSPHSLGGTGNTSDWDLAARLARKRRVILAGGLREENVASALRVVRPFGLDVCTGVETAPGIKDRELMSRFLDSVMKTARSSKEE